MSVKGGAIRLRLLTGLALAGAALVLIWAPGLRIGFTLFIALLAVIGLRELYAMARAKELEPQSAGGVAGVFAMVVSGYWCDQGLTCLVLLIAFASITWLHVANGPHSLPGFAVSVLGLLYVGWLGSYIVLLHGLPVAGPGLVTLLILTIALSDSGAYFVGSTMGKHKLAPKLSPNKTWEGAVGGLVWALAGCALFWAVRERTDWSMLPGWSLARYLASGAAMAVAGQMGDLAESMMKRDAGVKESGHFLPGHGGVLDRCDGLLFAAPVLYYVIEF